MSGLFPQPDEWPMGDTQSEFDDFMASLNMSSTFDESVNMLQDSASIPRDTLGSEMDPITTFLNSNPFVAMEETEALPSYLHPPSPNAFRFTTIPDPLMAPRADSNGRLIPMSPESPADGSTIDPAFITAGPSNFTFQCVPQSQNIFRPVTQAIQPPAAKMSNVQPRIHASLSRTHWLNLAAADPSVCNRMMKKKRWNTRWEAHGSYMSRTRQARREANATRA